jgi:hypothetical protein
MSMKEVMIMRPKKNWMSAAVVDVKVSMHSFPKIWELPRT